MILETIPDLTIHWNGEALHASVTFMASKTPEAAKDVAETPRYLFTFKNWKHQSAADSPFLIIVPQIDETGSRWVPHESASIKDISLAKAAGAALEAYLA